MRKKWKGRILASFLAMALMATTLLSMPIAEIMVSAEDSIVKAWTDNFDGWSRKEDWDYQYTGQAAAVEYDSSMAALKIPVDYTGSKDQDWSQATVGYWEEGLDFTGVDKVGFDFIYDSGKKTTGAFKIKIFSEDSSVDYTADVNEEGAADVSGTIKKVHVEVPLVNGLQKSDNFAIYIVGSKTDYKGDLWLKDIKVYKAGTSEPEEPVNPEEPGQDLVKAWTDKFDKWYYGGKDWEHQYQGENTSVGYDQDKEALKVTVDYSKDAGVSWSQLAACYYEDELNLTGAKRVELDFIYDTSKLTKGGFKLKVFSNGGADDDVTVDTDTAEEISGTALKKAHIVVPLKKTLSKAPDFTICVIGNETDYKGDLWLKNIAAYRSGVEQEDLSIDSTVEVKDQTNLSVGDLKLPSGITLVDKDATETAKALYAYLKAMGESKYVIFGHQDDIWRKAGSPELSNSDTIDVTGSMAGVVGIDTLALVGNEYSAGEWNGAYGGNLPNTIEGNIQAAANISNKAIEDGGIITLSAHMPNFSVVGEAEGYQEGDPSYTKYDFSGYTPNTLSGNVVNQILPGGQYNEKYTAFLDMVAEYAKKVNGGILFRPFHENTGSWFWWGAAFCDPVTYKSIYKYTVEYLRDTKDVHNILYVYGPGSEAASVAEYGERYPGDEYVDMVGFDMYNNPPTAENPWYQDFEAELNIVNTFAKEHGKLIAVTETGSQYASPQEEGDNQTALLKTGNPARNWYNHILDMVSESDASYFLLWANFGKNDGFYTPYVDYKNDDGTLHGHEVLDDFIKFYNDERSVFADKQKNVLSGISGNITAKPAADGATGYITTPVSGNRVLEPMALKAKVTGTPGKVEFVLHGDVEVTLTAVKDGEMYTADLSAEDLQKMGERVGTIDLVIDSKVKDTVNATFNIQPPEIDPYEIDDFENYYGQDNLLNQAWATNKDTGNTIGFTLSQEKGTVFSGNYSMKFYYDETSTGWAGATISKEVDWSGCNALQFYTIPDGKNQKVVIQITAGGRIYEAYMNTYDGYAQDVNGEPLLVTIPFSEFVDRDAAGQPKGGLTGASSKVEGFGLWVNAIGDSPAIVDGRVSGTIYYDKITAVTTDKTEVTFEKAEPGQEEPGGEEPGGNTPGGNTPGGNTPGQTNPPQGTTSTEIDSDKLDDILIAIRGAKPGETLSIRMVNNDTIVKKEILAEAKGKNVNIQLKMAGYTWTINGMDITADKLEDINLKVTVDTKNIPAKTIKALAGDRPAIQLSLEHNGKFPFTATLTVNVDKEKKYVGKYGSLFYYNKDKKMEFVDAGKTNENGDVSLVFTHASEYVLVISDQKMSQADVPASIAPSSGNNGNSSPKTGDNAMVLTWMLCGFFAVGIILFMCKKKKAW